jgi:hypothetical protein
MLRADPVLNVVKRLKHLGFDPRRVADDCWVARCPLCAGARALTVSRASLVVCRNPKCKDFRILQTIGLPRTDAYNPTHPAVIRELSAVPIEPLFDDVVPIRPRPAPWTPRVERLTSAPSAQTSAPSDAGTGHPIRVEFSTHATPPQSPAERDPSSAPLPGAGLPGAPAAATSRVERAVAAIGAMLDENAGLVPGRRHRGADGMSRGEPATSPRNEAQAGSGSESLAATAQTIRGSDGHYYALLPVEGRFEFYRLESGELRRALGRLHARSTGRTAPQAAIAIEVDALRARAESSDRVDTVFLRVAHDPSETAYLLDLGDAARRAVKIGAHGWQIVERHGAHFWRPPSQRALPTPASGQSIERLRRFANVSDLQWPLLLGWLTSAMRPVGPFPVLVLNGEQGSAKTTLARVCRLLIDPAAGPLRAPPKSERDIMIGAQNNWLQVFDNLSALSAWQSDAFCRLSSGGAFATRGRFSDDREVVIEAQRPIILNGIADFVQHPDLVDRSVFLWMQPLPESERRGDLAFWEEFGREHGLLFGALLDAAAGGIRLWPQVQLKAMTRMADFDRWGEAVLRALGYREGTFVEAYRANRRLACERALEESPVVTAVRASLERHTALHCSPTDLLRILNDFKPEHATGGTGWPKTPWALSRVLRRLAPQLRGIGIDFATTVEHSGRVITLVRPET